VVTKSFGKITRYPSKLNGYRVIFAPLTAHSSRAVNEKVVNKGGIECLDNHPGLNFINVLCTAFMLVDPQSVKIQLSRQYLLTLLGSTGTKSAHRMLMKLTP